MSLADDLEKQALETGIAHYFGPGGNTFDLFTGGAGGYYNDGKLRLYNYQNLPIPPELQALADKYGIASPEAAQAAADPNGPGNNEGGSDLANILKVAGIVAAPAFFTGGFGGLGGSTSGFGFGTPESLIGTGGGGSTAGSIYGGGGLLGNEGGNMDLFDLTDYLNTTGNAAVADTLSGVSDLSGLGLEQFANPGWISSLAQALGTTPTNLSRLLGAALPAGLGALGSYQQTNALKDLAQKYQEFGAPYRQRLSDLYANPSSFLSSPEVQSSVQQGTDALARSLSAKVGNPIGNMGALQDIQNYSANQLFGKLGQEKDRLAGFGGLSNYNAAAPGLETSAVGSNANIFNAIGAGLGSYFNPPTNLETLLKSLSGAGNIFKVT